MDMKKLIVGFVVMAFCAVKSPSMAATKLPTNLCINWQGTSLFNSLAIKNGSGLKTSDGTAKQYSIVGNTNWSGTVTFPVNGSGYIVPGTTVFHGAFSGAYPGASFLVALDLYYDFALNNGILYYHLDDGAAVQEGDVTVITVDCSALPLFF
jgi:hypothetical protein